MQEPVNETFVLICWDANGNKGIHSRKSNWVENVLGRNFDKLISKHILLQNSPTLHGKIRRGGLTIIGVLSH